MAESKVNKDIKKEEVSITRFGELLNIKQGGKIWKGSILGRVDSSDYSKGYFYAEVSGSFCIPTNYYHMSHRRSYLDVYSNPYILFENRYGLIYKHVNDLIEENYSFAYEIIVDKATQNKKINWLRCDSFEIGKIRDGKYWDICYKIELNIDNAQPCLSFSYLVKGKASEGGIKLKKGDKLYLCNSKESFLELEIIRPPHASKDTKFKTVDFLLVETDVECLLNNKLQDISIQFKDGSPSVILSHDFDEAFMSKLFQTYVKFYKNALKHAGLYKVNKKVKAEVSFEFDYCSVYLMHDTRNGFHKIGISKTPTYREKTLQSEKPTIELICSKEYPSRKIAEAIESALHKVYENNRIRGEWFDLSEKDILIIRETLK